MLASCSNADFDIVIRNGTVVDGSGDKAYKKDIGILARGGFSYDLSKRVLELDAAEFNKLFKII